VFSAGTTALPGAPVSNSALAAAKEHDVDLTGKSSTPLTPDLVEASDLILVMERRHRERIVRMSPAAATKTRVITELAPEAGVDEIADPFGGSLETYRRCFADLRRILTLALPRLAEMAEHHESRPGRDAAPGAP
jgi:protein-tyrosine-phosphatase